MKILQINSVCGRGSTGRIATDLADILAEQRHECRIAYGRDTVPEKYRDIAIRIGTDWDVKWHGMATRLFDAHGFASTKATEKFLHWVQEYNPDIIHLHNIHGYYINIELLFNYIKSAHKPVVWTLHDCWAFTGHCGHFSFIQCNQWVSRCSCQCPQKRSYPVCYGISRAHENFARKKVAFTGVENLTLVTPSHWLAGLVRQSFLNEYPVQVIPNGIDLNVFKPTESNFREKHGLLQKKIVLGVANVWGRRKGLNDFIQLSQMLDEKYAIVLVGLSEKHISSLPKNILGIQRTQSVQELAEIYSAADVFVNPTHEDNFPTTNLEALACGTPIITYDVGGSPEALYGSEGKGYVVKENMHALADKIEEIQGKIEHDMRFEKKAQFMKYYTLYNTIR